MPAWKRLCNRLREVAVVTNEESLRRQGRGTDCQCESLLSSSVYPVLQLSGVNCKIMEGSVCPTSMYGVYSSAWAILVE